MWDKKKLEQVSRKRQNTRDQIGPKVQKAALLYAEWQGMPHERKTTPQMAKAELDLLLDTMQPEDWANLDKMAGEVGEPAIRGLMTYSLKRAAAAVKEQASEVGKMQDWPVSGAPKSKPRDKDRDR
jgi:hypothetical protein